ncbi:unnamed protein product [Phyllotreta striolata]|uniref:Lysosome-associated membrane glycoprotein 5 n=1 Tax=Phyllotreta striolata TaxID=444603 RepID=A0A9P0E093_PHYSR|nr:unnamed protein product [Phyllotreta striolata]
MWNNKILLILPLIVLAACAQTIEQETAVPGKPHPKPTTPSPNSTTTVSPNSTTTTPPKTTTVAPNSTTTAPPKTTTVAPNSTTTAPPKTTTVAPNSTTTAPPKTTTVAPNSTTTAPPNTTTVAPKPTTVSPNSTTVVPPTTTTPGPKPVPDPSIGNWTVKDGNNSCFVMDAAIQIEYPVNTTNKINIPVNSTLIGACNKMDDVIVLKWEKNVFTMNFTKDVNASKFALASIRADLFNLSLPNGTFKNVTLIHNVSEFGTPLGNSYKCKKVQTLNLTGEANMTGYLHISHLQMQAFANTTGHKFDSAIDCEASPITSDVVPIVVGCVLAALVVMIMVAYLVARRRCQARGYHSIDAQPDD